MRVMYVEAQAMAIRRLVDASRSKDTRSLWHLVGDLADHATILSRERFLCAFGDDPRQQRIGEQKFDELAGEGAEYVSRRRLEKLRAQVRIAGAEVKRHSDELVAHNARGSAPSATWGALRAAIDGLAACTREVGVVLQRSPAWLRVGTGWQAVFRGGLFLRE